MNALLKKILWVDNNIDSIVFPEMLEKSMPVVISKVKSPVTAIKMLQGSSHFSLVISGELFPNSSGVYLFKQMMSLGFRYQFLLFTAKSLNSEIQRMCLLDNFTYFSKMESDLDSLQMIVEELVNKDCIFVEEICVRLRAIRRAYGMTVSEFAQYFNIPASRILESEEKIDKVGSSHLLLICKDLNITVDFFMNSPSNVFEKMLGDLKTEVKRKKVRG